MNKSLDLDTLGLFLFIAVQSQSRQLRQGRFTFGWIAFFYVNSFNRYKLCRFCYTH